MRTVLPWILIAVLPGCAWDPFGPQKQTYPAYTPNNAPPVTYANNAAAALIYQVVAAALRDPQKIKQLWGECRIKSSETNIFMPCNNVAVSLCDSQGREISSTRTEEGKFTFVVELKKSYRLRVSSKLYQVSDEPIGPFQGGDGVTLELKPAGRIPSALPSGPS